MQASRTIFVTGATGNQGGAVVRNLLGKGFHIKALTRDAESEKARLLEKDGVQVIRGNLDEPSGFSEHVRDVYGIFSVQSMEKGSEREIRQGMMLADLANEFDTAHFIYTSVASAPLHTGIPHFESKLAIEVHIKKLGIPYTIIRPVSLLENFLFPQVKNRILKGKLVSPVAGKTVQQFIAAEDVGRIAVEAFMNPSYYIAKTIPLAAEQMNMEEVATVFSDVIKMPVRYRQLPGIITRLAMGKDIYHMFKWINSHQGIFTDLAASKMENPGMMDLKTWIRKNFKTASQLAMA